MNKHSINTYLSNEESFLSSLSLSHFLLLYLSLLVHAYIHILELSLLLIHFPIQLRFIFLTLPEQNECGGICKQERNQQCLEWKLSPL